MNKRRQPLSRIGDTSRGLGRGKGPMISERQDGNKKVSDHHRGYQVTQRRESAGRILSKKKEGVEIIYR